MKIFCHYIDDRLIVAEKPHGLLSVPGKGEHKRDCMVARLTNQFGDIKVVHRLDMETSGIMLFARDIETQRQLSRQFERREITKRYIAVCKHHFTPEMGIVDLPLRCDWPNRPKQKVDFLKGKPSLTLFKVVARMGHNQATRVLLTPITGRSHQLRVHMMALGHAILGDRLYSDTAGIKASPRLLLHAARISFRHPTLERKLAFYSPEPF